MFQFRFVSDGLVLFESGVCGNRATALNQARLYVLDLLRQGWRLDGVLDWKMLQSRLFHMAGGQLCLRGQDRSGCVEIVSLS